LGLRLTLGLGLGWRLLLHPHAKFLLELLSRTERAGFVPRRQCRFTVGVRRGAGDAKFGQRCGAGTCTLGQVAGWSRWRRFCARWGAGQGCAFLETSFWGSRSSFALFSRPRLRSLGTSIQSTNLLRMTPRRFREFLKQLAILVYHRSSLIPLHERARWFVCCYRGLDT